MPAFNPTVELLRRELLRFGPFGAFRERYELVEDFRRIPHLDTAWDDITDPPSLADSRIFRTYNQDFVLSGTNADPTDCLLNVDGGVDFITAGADNDQVIVSPRGTINSIESTAWNVVTLEPQHESRFQVLFEMPAVTLVLVHFGLSLTPVLDLTTDADQAKIQFSVEGAVSTTKFTALESIAGTDTETLLNHNADVAVDKTYNLEVRYSSTGIARFYVDGVKRHTAALAHTAAASLKPFFGIQALEGAAKTLRMRQMRASRVWQDQ